MYSCITHNSTFTYNAMQAPCVEIATPFAVCKKNFECWMSQLKDVQEPQEDVSHRVSLEQRHGCARCCFNLHVSCLFNLASFHIWSRNYPCLLERPKDYNRADDAYFFMEYLAKNEYKQEELPEYTNDVIVTLQSSDNRGTSVEMN